MKRYISVILLLMPVLIYAQSERKLIRQGYKSYMDGDYNNAEVDFRKAEQVNKESFIAKYNTSTALYQQEKIEESSDRFSELIAETSDDIELAKLHHNIGNSFLEQKKYQESIDAYKKSLRLNPGDDDTRYNLAYALEKLREQQQQNQDQNQENKKDKNQDQENQDQEQDQDQEKQEQEKDQEQDQEKDQEKDQKQPVPQQLSKEDAERLLNAILQKEKDVKEKVDQKKAAAAKIKTDKDW